MKYFVLYNLDSEKYVQFDDDNFHPYDVKDPVDGHRFKNLNGGGTWDDATSMQKKLEKNLFRSRFEIHEIETHSKILNKF